MELCSHNHAEVAYEGRKCPICELIEEHKERAEEHAEQVRRFELQIEEEQAIALSYKEKWQASEAEVTRLCKGQLDGER